jgi:TonB family protein
MLLLLNLAAIAAAAPPVATSAKARSKVAAYFSDDDYPAEAIRMEEQGTVGFRLSVSAKGAVTSCTVTASSGSAILDSTTCRLMSERATFTPARNARGKAVPDSVQARILWALPPPQEDPEPINIGESLRSITNVWEVTADGRQRSCRREQTYEGGERLDVPDCSELNRSFVTAAAAFLKARPEEILTVSLENRWTLDPARPFPAVPEHRGQVLVRGEGDYRLNEDLTVGQCLSGSFSARFTWRPEPCFRKAFSDYVPAGTERVRMEVQWVVSRGPDLRRPAQLPQFTPAGGKPTPVTLQSRPPKSEPSQAEPLKEGASPR